MLRRLVLILILLTVPVTAMAEDVPAKARCAVCGMFVAKHPHFVCEIKADGKIRYFDGAKDMFVFYFNPTAFGGKADDKKGEILVKDYYHQEMVDGRRAFYVIGSDILGPMGYELIPFKSREAAENFKADHKGKKVLTFVQVTAGLVESMRKGMKMMDHHGMKMKK